MSLCFCFFFWFLFLFFVCLFFVFVCFVLFCFVGGGVGRCKAVPFPWLLLMSYFISRECREVISTIEREWRHRMTSYQNVGEKQLGIGIFSEFRKKLLQKWILILMT